MTKITIKKRQYRFNCPVCYSKEMKIFYQLAAVPASCNFLWATKEEATNCPKGDITLAFCPVCSYITNIALEPEKNVYNRLYDNSLFYSNQFQEFTKELTKELVQRFYLCDKTIVEIGSGKVDFITEMCKLVKNRPRMYNPFNVFDENKYIGTSHTTESISRFQSNIFNGLEADFIFSYHELEHINYPREFLSNLQKMIRRNPNVRTFFAVPNALKALETGSYTDIIYEHVSYFTPFSLSFLFSSCGFEVLHTEETIGGIFDSIFIEAIPGSNLKYSWKSTQHSEINHIEECAISFADRTRTIIKNSYQRIKKLMDEGKRLVIWGAGARGVTLLNILRASFIEYAVDINPRKQGKFVPGTGQKIVPPKFLKNYRPDYIILANQAYETEIREIINSLEIETEFIVI